MIGGDFSLQQARRTQLDSGSDSLLVKPEDGYQNGMLFAVNILVNFAQGSDALYLAYGFQSGFIGSFIICIVLLLSTQFAFMLFLKSWRYGKEYNYVDIWKGCISKSSTIIPKLLLFICFLAIAASFSYEVYSDFQLIIVSLTKTESSIINNKWMWGFIMTFVAAIIGIIPERFIDLNITSIISNIAMFVSGAAVITAFIMKCIKSGFDPNHQMKLISFDQDYLSDCIGSFATIFFLSPIVYHLLINIKKPTYRRVSNMVWIANIITGVYCYVVGFCSYALFFEFEENDNILYLLEESNYPCFIVGLIGCYICTICTLACYFRLVLVYSCDLFLENAKPTPFARFIYVCAYVCSNVLFDWVSDTIFEWWSLIGHLCFMCLAFILPGVYYFKNFGFSNLKQSIWAIAVVLIGLAIQLYVIITTIIGLVSE